VQTVSASRKTECPKNKRYSRNINSPIINLSQPLQVGSQQINVKFIPYHERLKNYNEVRERIFSGIDRKSHRNTIRMRKYFGERKAKKNNI